MELQLIKETTNRRFPVKFWRIFLQNISSGCFWQFQFSCDFIKKENPAIFSVLNKIFFSVLWILQSIFWNNTSQWLFLECNLPVLTKSTFFVLNMVCDVVFSTVFFQINWDSLFLAIQRLQEHPYFCSACVFPIMVIIHFYSILTSSSIILRIKKS